MCDCADSCSRMPIEKVNDEKQMKINVKCHFLFFKVNQIYGQSSANHGDNGCFLRTYIQVLKNELSILK